MSKRPLSPANDNGESLPNNGWWIITVAWFGMLAALAFAGLRALGML